jgi:ribonuclease D
METPSAPPLIHDITTSAALAEAAAGWRTAPALALDTEFVRERTFFAQLGLIQVADDKACYLIDPIATADLTPLGEILSDPKIVKVAHSVSEDLEVLYHQFGSFPEPLFDTQVAAALAGHDASMGYRRLVQDLFSVELAKEHTRTNWLRRPLSPEQKLYAARDVEHLLPAYDILRAELETTERVDWVFEESRRLSDAQRILPDPEGVYRRISGIGKLDRRRLATVQRLAAWRETRARERDLPRNFVLRESSLLAIARKLPTSREDLTDIPDLVPRQADSLADRILRTVGEVRRLDPSELPPPPPTLPRDERTKKTLATLVELVRKRAEELEIPPTTLASRRELREFLLSATEDRVSPPPPPFDGWRWDIIGRDLLAAI